MLAAAPPRGGLRARTDLVDGARLLGARARRDRAAAPAPADYQRLALEHAQRLADRGAADAEAPAQLVLGDARARAEAVLDDLALEQLPDVSGKDGGSPSRAYGWPVAS